MKLPSPLYASSLSKLRVRASTVSCVRCHVQVTELRNVEMTGDVVDYMHEVIASLRSNSSLISGPSAKYGDRNSACWGFHIDCDQFAVCCNVNRVADMFSSAVR